MKIGIQQILGGALFCMGGALLGVQDTGVLRPPVDKPILGFVEDHPAAEAGKSGPGLRVAFRRHGKDWTSVMGDQVDPSSTDQGSVPGLGSRRSWTVLDGGLRVGAVTTEGWLDAATYSQRGLLNVTGPAPMLGAPSLHFGGWTGEARHRPLLAYYGPLAPKPAPWHARPVRKDDLKVVWPAFRKAVPHLPRCASDGALLSPQPATSARDLEVFQALEDGRGSRLLGARLREGALGTCDGVPDRSRSDFWFLVSTKGKVSALEMPEGDDAITLTPLDFLGMEEGRSTVAVFFCSGYNHDGYRIYYDGFRKSAECAWNYH